MTYAEPKETQMNCAIPLESGIKDESIKLGPKFTMQLQIGSTHMRMAASVNMNDHE
jgi:hypothetical protein